MTAMKVAGSVSDPEMFFRDLTGSQFSNFDLVCKQLMF